MLSSRALSQYPDLHGIILHILSKYSANNMRDRLLLVLVLAACARGGLDVAWREKKTLEYYIQIETV